MAFERKYQFPRGGMKDNPPREFFTNFRICNDHMECRDHHCVWLDVCVFRYNYKQFMAFLVCTSIAALDVACILG